MLNVGVIGFGGMGHFHAASFMQHPDVRLAAVADILPERLSGESMSINIGDGAACDMSGVHAYTSADEMLASEGLDIVSICTPTDIHAEYAIRAFDAGCHVLCEKPMSRALSEADAQIEAQKRSGKLFMIAQCLRFWPCYEKLAEVYRAGVYGKLLMLSMRRVSPCPGWDADSWFADGQRSGGALLDMHIHDTDFTNWLLGVPRAVITVGATHTTGAIDNAVTQYVYDNGPTVMAETSWCYAHGFTMSFCAIFEDATLEMGYTDGDLTLIRGEGGSTKMELSDETGHDREIAYFLDCVRTGREPEKCTPFSTRETMRIALAEEQSALAGGGIVEL